MTENQLPAENQLPKPGLTKEIVFIAVCLIIFAFAIYKTVLPKKPETEIIPVGQPVPTIAENVENTVPPQTLTPVVAPTKTPQEVKIISQIETKRVDIKEKSIEPNPITIKLHDQIQFYNSVSASQKISIIGTGWGGAIKFSFGDNLTQPFDKLGEFPYTIPELNLQGKVIVQ